MLLTTYVIVVAVAAEKVLGNVAELAVHGRIQVVSSYVDPRI